MLGSCIELLQKVITTCSLRVAVDEDEAIDHRWPPMGKSDETVGPEADREPDKVRDPEVVADVFNLKVGQLFFCDWMVFLY